MNNEEKILALLENMATKDDISAINDNLSAVNSRLDRIENRVDKIENRVVKIEITQENQIVPNIKLLAEGHSLTVEKLDTLDTLVEKVEDIQNTVDVLKYIAVKKDPGRA